MLPDVRFKMPIGFRLNYHINDFLIFRSFYRYYWDTWEMTGHTVDLSLPIKIGQGLRLYPFYRYHHQDAIAYFAEFGQHDPTAAFFHLRFLILSTIFFPEIWNGYFDSTFIWIVALQAKRKQDNHAEIH